MTLAIIGTIETGNPQTIRKRYGCPTGSIRVTVRGGSSREHIEAGRDPLSKLNAYFASSAARERLLQHLDGTFLEFSLKKAI